MKRKQLEIGHKIATVYEVAGTGDVAAVFLHGVGGNGRMWAGTMRALRRYGRMISIDLPGFADHREPLEDLSAYAPFVGEVLAALDIEAAVWVGNSFGGRIALEAALELPERVRGLALLCSAGVHVAGVPVVPPNSIPKEEFDRLAFYNTERFTMLQSEESRQTTMRSGELYATLAGRTAVLDFAQRLGEIRVPTHVIWGRHDGVLPLPIGEWIAGQIPGAELTVLERTAHVPQLERPAEVEAVVQRLFDRVTQVASVCESRHI
ncbi:MAG: alpha/beta hydrolase [Tumebacillaceae bacterium]